VVIAIAHPDLGRFHAPKSRVIGVTDLHQRPQAPRTRFGHPVGLVNLFGIESPGLTSALAIGDYVRDMQLS